MDADASLSSKRSRYPLGAAVTLEQLDTDPYGPLARLRDLCIEVMRDAGRFTVFLRPNSRSHLAFAQGPRACVGIHLARLETVSALDAALDGWPGLRVDTGSTPPSGVIFRKPRSLPVRWDRSP